VLRDAFGASWAGEAVRSHRYGCRSDGDPTCQARELSSLQRARLASAPGINCLIGPGDRGKTTILEAIARATSPAPAGPADEHDYFRRRTEDGFEIELVIGALDSELLGAFSVAPCWGWRGPSEEMLKAPVAGAEAVLRLVVRGTADLEIEHRLVAPNGEELGFGADKRRLLGLCRIGEMRGSSREFRMARGSLLERTLGREDVRGAAARAVRDASQELELPDGVTQRLAGLSKRLCEEGIGSDDATLEVLAPPGQSLLGLLGLALGEPGEAIPLAFSGHGTQRVASFVLATALADAPALLVMDELEFGLEPYRQRLLVSRMRELLKKGGQAFLTTHAPAVVDELEVGELHRLTDEDSDGAIRVKRFDRSATPSSAPKTPVAVVTPLATSIGRLKARHPETLLCALPVVCEGTTEVALLARLLEGFAVASGRRMPALGIQLVDGCGQPQAFEVISGLRAAGFQVGAFLDVEHEHSGRRKSLVDEGVITGAFSEGACTEMAIAASLSEPLLDALPDVAHAEMGRVGDARRQQLGHAVGREGNLPPSSLAQEFGWEHVRRAIGEVAHKSDWFKTKLAASALASWLADGRLPAQMTRDLQTFWERLLEMLQVQEAPRDAHDVAR